MVPGAARTSLLAAIGERKARWRHQRRQGGRHEPARAERESASRCHAVGASAWRERAREAFCLTFCHYEWMNVRSARHLEVSPS